jgi:hypothetical protein
MHRRTARVRRRIISPRFPLVQCEEPRERRCDVVLRRLLRSLHLRLDPLLLVSSLASSCALSLRPRRLRGIYNGDQCTPRGMTSFSAPLEKRRTQIVDAEAIGLCQPAQRRPGRFPTAPVRLGFDRGCCGSLLCFAEPHARNRGPGGRLCANRDACAGPRRHRRVACVMSRVSSWL